MRKIIFNILAICALSFLLPSCGERNGGNLFPLGDTLEIRHASYLQMVEGEDYTVVNLRNPWDTLRTLHTYVLVSRDKACEVDSLPKGTVVRVPLQRSVIYTAVHCGLVF